MAEKKRKKSTSKKANTSSIKKTTQNKKVNSKTTNDDLIITRQLDINLSDYQDNQDKLVQELKTMLEHENAVDEETEYLQSFYDPLEGEELITDTFKKKSWLQKIFKHNNSEKNMNIIERVRNDKSIILVAICVMMVILLIILLSFYYFFK